MVALRVAVKVRDKFTLFDEDGLEIKHVRKVRSRSHNLYQLEYADGSLGYASGRNEVSLFSDSSIGRTVASKPTG